MDFWQYDVLPPHERVPIQAFPSGCVALRFNLRSDHLEPVLYGPSLRAEMTSVFWSDELAFGAALQLPAARDVLRCDVVEPRHVKGRAI